MKKRILLVDDNAPLRNLLANALRMQGCEVIACSDGSAALVRIESMRFDSAVVEVRLPGASGFDVLSHLRSRQPQASAFVISGSLTNATREMAERWGAQCIDKPFDLEMISLLIAQSAGTTGARPWSVLVVDDEEQLASLLHAYLSDLGFSVVKAFDGAEALERVAQAKRPFDVAFVDINMSRIDGVTLIRELGVRSPETLPVIMTGEATSEQVRQAYAAGAETMLKKPFEIDTLPRLIESLDSMMEDRRARTAAQRARERRTRMQRWGDAARRIATDPVQTGWGRIRLGASICAAALAVVWISAGLIASLGDAVERNRALEQAWIERLESRRRSPALMPIVIQTAAAEAETVSPADRIFQTESAGDLRSNRIQRMEEFVSRIEGYLQRDEARELGGRDAPVGMRP